MTCHSKIRNFYTWESSAKWELLLLFKKKLNNKDRTVLIPGDSQLDILCEEQEWVENAQGQESS